MTGLLSAPMAFSSVAVMAAGEGWNDTETERLFSAARDLGVPLLSESVPRSSLLLGLEYRIVSDDSLRLAIARDESTHVALDRFLDLQSGEADEIASLLEGIAAAQMNVDQQRLKSMQARDRENTLTRSARLFEAATGKMGPPHIEKALREAGYIHNRQVRSLATADEAIGLVTTILGADGPEHWDLIDSLSYVNDELGLVPVDKTPLNRLLARYTAYETAWFGDKGLALVEPLTEPGLELQRMLTAMDQDDMTRDQAQAEHDLDRIIAELRVAIAVTEAYLDQDAWIRELRPWYSETTRDRFIMRLLKGKNLIRRGIESAQGLSP